MKIKSFFKTHKLFLSFVFFLLAFSLFLMFFLRMDIDYYWHFKAGEYMVSHGKILMEDVFSWSMQHLPWISHEWLFDIFIYGLSLVFGKYHLFVYVFSVSLTLLLFLFFIQKQEYLKNIPFSLLWVSFFSLIFLGLSGRPQLLSFLLLAITVWILFYYFYHPNSKKIYFLPIISVLWANIHGGSSNLCYLLCFLTLFCGLFSFSLKKIEANRLSGKQLLKLFIIGVICLGVIVINPHGVKMLTYPYVNMGDSLMLTTISEWQPSNLNVLSHYVYFAFMLIVLFVFLFSNKKIRFFDFIFYLVFLYLGLKSIRFWFFSYIVCSMFIFYYIPKRNVDRGSSLLICIFSIILVFMFIFDFSYSKVISYQSLSDDAITVLKDEKPERLFNYYDYGAYLIYNDIDVFVDGRADLYSGEVYQDYQTLSRLKPSFSKVIDKYNFDYYILPRDIGLTTYLKEKYEIIYKDKECLIFKAN